MLLDNVIEAINVIETYLSFVDRAWIYLYLSVGRQPQNNTLPSRLHQDIINLLYMCWMRPGSVKHIAGDILRWSKFYLSDNTGVACFCQNITDVILTKHKQGVEFLTSLKFLYRKECSCLFLLAGRKCQAGVC